MLRDITFGQYYESNSLLHKTDPRFKIVILILLIVFIFLAKNAFSLGFAAAAMAAVVTDINRTRLPVCQNRLIEEMPGICSGHLFFMIFVATPFPCI